MRTWEDGIIDALEELHVTDRHAHSKVVTALLCPSIYLRAKKTGRLRKSGIARVAKQSQRDPRNVLIHTTNTTRH